MPRKSAISLSFFVVFLVVFVGGAFAYDSATSRVLPAGVEVGGIEVGGLSAAEARSKLQRDLLGALEVPVTATRDGRSWHLTAASSKVAVDIDGSVNAALAEGNAGNFFARSYRKLTGSELNASVDPTVTYSRASVEQFVERVTKDIDRPAQDASLAFTIAAVAPVPSRRGLAVKQRWLTRAVAKALSTPGASHSVAVAVRVLKPKVTTSELASKYPLLITVDRSNFRLTLFKDLKPVKTYTIAVGQAGLETPAGLYSVQDKQINPTWNVPKSDWAGELAGKVIPPGPENPLKARWMGIAGGAGIHGTDAIGSLGTAASHGCIRMAIPDVIDLFDRVNVGTPVFIA